MPEKRLFLASSSPWRAASLQRLRLPFETIGHGIDEKAIREADPETLTKLIARAKALDVIKRVPGPSVVIACDEVVFFRGEIREKPPEESRARAWLASYSAQLVETVTSVVMIESMDGSTAAEAVHVDHAFVRFGRIVKSVVEAAIARGTVLHCAGALAVGDPDLDTCIADIYGDRASVQGLPLGPLVRMLQSFGCNLP